MAMTAEKINLNFNAAARQAKRLEEIADQLEREMKNLGTELDNLGAIWTGAASNDYRKQGGDVKELMRKNVSNIRSIASAIRQTANAYRELENQKLEEAESKKK